MKTKLLCSMLSIKSSDVSERLIAITVSFNCRHLGHSHKLFQYSWHLCFISITFLHNNVTFFFSRVPADDHGIEKGHLCNRFQFREIKAARFYTFNCVGIQLSVSNVVQRFSCSCAS